MRPRYVVASAIVSLFFAVVFASAFILNPHFPGSILAGESSVSTWASGMLLVMSATISLIFAIRRGWFPWSLITLFFLVLALDERFMFHEFIKSIIIFHYQLDPSQNPIQAELPVIAGAMVGLMVAFVLWRQLNTTGRMLLFGAVAFGIMSVTMDVFSLGVLLEDTFKVFAELLVVCALLTEV